MKLVRVKQVFEFPVRKRSAPRRPRGLSEHTMLISLFRDGTPLMAFVKHLYRTHGIISVQHWDDAGGDLFDGFPLDEDARSHFMNTIGIPERRRSGKAADIVALFPHP